MPGKAPSASKKKREAQPRGLLEKLATNRQVALPAHLWGKKIGPALAKYIEPAHVMMNSLIMKNESARTLPAR